MDELLMTAEQERRMKKALAASPDIKTLSKPYITDNG